MIHRHEADKLFTEVFTAFPSYREYMEKQPDPNGTLDAWCKQIARCDPDSVRIVVARIVQGDVDLRSKYESKDMLGLSIRSKAERLSDERRKQQHMAKLSKQASRKELDDSESEVRDRGVRFGHAHSSARLFRAAVELGLITEDENAVMMSELTTWMRNGTGEIPKLNAKDRGAAEEYLRTRGFGARVA